MASTSRQARNLETYHQSHSVGDQVLTMNASQTLLSGQTIVLKFRFLSPVPGTLLLLWKLWITVHCVKNVDPLGVWPLPTCPHWAHLASPLTSWAFEDCNLFLTLFLWKYLIPEALNWNIGIHQNYFWNIFLKHGL